MTSLKNIGRRIASERKKKRITQDELAGLAEMDRSYLSEIENGHKNFSITSLFKISEALKVKASQLLEDK